MAYGALREAARARLRVPEDLAVMGFDDQPFAELMNLSSVRQPVADQARSVTTRLLAHISGSESDDPSRDPAVVLATDLVLRASTEGGSPPA